MQLRPIPTALALLATAGTVAATFTNPYTPPYRGLPGTEYSAWESFDVPFGGVNLPDDPASTSDDATLENLESSAFDIGGNIYSFSAPIDCVLRDSVPSDLQELDLQVSTIGEELDYAGVRLEYVDGLGVTQSLAPDAITVLFLGPNTGGGGGVLAETLFSWDLDDRSDDITVYEVRFQGAAPSVSLDAVVLDTRFADHATTYCTAKLNSQGCLPAISAQGIPSASLAAPFTVAASGILPNTVGVLIYGTGGPAAFPFQGGTLCMGSPVNRTAGQFSGGSAACSGSFTYDFNALIQSGQGAGLAAGVQVQAQFWSRDQGFAAPNNSNLTDAVEFVIQD